MPTLKEPDLLAIQLHRALDGQWYAVGTFVDKSIGKHGQRILADVIAPETMAKLIDLIVADVDPVGHAAQDKPSDD